MSIRYLTDKGEQRILLELRYSPRRVRRGVEPRGSITVSLSSVTSLKLRASNRRGVWLRFKNWARSNKCFLHHLHKSAHTWSPTVGIDVHSLLQLFENTHLRLTPSITSFRTRPIRICSILCSSWCVKWLRSLLGTAPSDLVLQTGNHRLVPQLPPLQLLQARFGSVSIIFGICRPL